MVFSSLEFIYLFLPPVFLGFMILRALRLETAIIFWLIGASLTFYAWWSPPHLLLILGSVTFNYAVHLALQRQPAKALFVFGVIVNLALLATFKYADFLIGNFNAVSGQDIGALGLVLPLAISFYTFQQISFLHDSWKGSLVATDFKRYLLFVTFFPQLIAGPIVMQRDTLPQFTLQRFLSRPALNFALGATLFSIGLFKKIVLADGVAPYANTVFTMADQGQLVGFGDAWFGSIAYTFQIYFDFSGYCDMALGLALLFGIRLPINFNSPYKALNIVDFWRRWHITLSNFLRDYLYIPLGGNRSGWCGTRGNLMITMLLGGLWHGAGWNFVIWGGLHGGFLMINHVWSGSTQRSVAVQLLPSWIYAMVAWTVTMLCVVVAWVFFRAETLDGALLVLHGMASLPQIGQMPTVLPGQALDLIAQFVALFGIVLLLPNSVEFTRGYRPVLHAFSKTVRHGGLFASMRWAPTPAWGAAIMVVASAGIIQIYRLNGLTEFIYFNF